MPAMATGSIPGIPCATAHSSVTGFAASRSCGVGVNQEELVLNQQNKGFYHRFSMGIWLKWLDPTISTFGSTGEVVLQFLIWGQDGPSSQNVLRSFKPCKKNIDVT